jgi:hypothetical protein
VFPFGIIVSKKQMILIIMFLECMVLLSNRSTITWIKINKVIKESISLCGECSFLCRNCAIFYGYRTTVGFKPSAILHYVRNFLPSCKVMGKSTLGVSQFCHFFVECAHGHMVARKHGKMITHFFCSKIYVWMRKYNIVVIVFSFDFEGEMNYLLPLCVHERVF